MCSAAFRTCVYVLQSFVWGGDQRGSCARCPGIGTVSFTRGAGVNAARRMGCGPKRFPWAESRRYDRGCVARRAAGLLCSGVLALAYGCIPSSISDSRSSIDSPPRLEEVDVVENLEAELPAELRFKDQEGREVRLGDLIQGKPTVLTLAYYSCPMLCGLVLSALADVVKETRGVRLGEDFNVVTVSFDPRDSAETAARRRKAAFEDMGRAENDHGWSFLHGNVLGAQTLADVVGYHFFFDEKQQEFAHPAALIFVDGSGRVKRYLYGLKFSPADFKLAVLETKAGNAKSTLDKVLLYCYRYDPEAGSYVLVAEQVMRLSGVLVLGCILLALAFFWRRERRRGGVGGLKGDVSR